MGRFIYFFISFTFILSSCEKEDTETIDKKLLIGNWERIEIDLTVYCTDYLEFTNESFRTKEICTSNALIGFFTEYKLEGNNIVVEGNVRYTIEYISPTLLKLHDSQGEFQEYKKP